MGINLKSNQIQNITPLTGAAATLAELRKELEARTGLSGKELRIEKVCYTGKEGKTAQGCPMAKWVSVKIGTISQLQAYSNKVKYSYHQK